MDKLYAGARLRRLREDRSLTQVDLARQLAISASYLNQIEHDTRPITVSVLLRVSEVLGVDAAFFAPQDTARRLAELREALTDDTGGPQPSAADLRQLVTTLPEASEAMIRLHQRHRLLLERLQLAVDERAGLETDPHQQVRDFFYSHQNHFDDLDRAAEELSERVEIRPQGQRGQSVAALRTYLWQTHRVEVVSGDGRSTGPGRSSAMHSYDPQRRRLTVSPALLPGQQAFRLATQLALLEHEALIEATVQGAGLQGEQTRSLARIGLANHLAGALVLPYREFYRAAEQARYDVELLAEQFDVSYETVAHRLSTLQRPGARGVPFILIRVDRAGNISKRQSATGFHFSRTGGTCPLWNVYEAFSTPGRTVVQLASMPDGQRYLWVARTVVGRPAGYGQPAKTFAVGLGCEVRQAGRLVYSRGLDLDDPQAATPIGPGCRTCERDACAQRASPAMGRRLAVDETRSTFVPYPVLRDSDGAASQTGSEPRVSSISS